MFARVQSTYAPPRNLSTVRCAASYGRAVDRTRPAAKNLPNKRANPACGHPKMPAAIFSLTNTYHGCPLPSQKCGLDRMDLVDGVIVVDKPSGISSRDAVRQMRWLARGARSVTEIGDSHRSHPTLPDSGIFHLRRRSGRFRTQPAAESNLHLVDKLLTSERQTRVRRSPQLVVAKTG